MANPYRHYASGEPYYDDFNADKNYVKVLFKQLLEEELITKKEYELLIKKLDEDINKVLDKGGLMWKKEK